MSYVGIDIAKHNHLASVLSSEGEVLVKPFKFTNDNDGFCRLLSAIESFDRSSLIIGLESMAHYGDNLVEFLVTRRFQVCVINPIQTSTMRKNNISKTTLVIARTLMTQPHRVYSQENIDFMHMKNLGRFRQNSLKSGPEQRSSLLLISIVFFPSCSTSSSTDFTKRLYIRFLKSHLSLLLLCI